VTTAGELVVGDDEESIRMTRSLTAESTVRQVSDRDLSVAGQPIRDSERFRVAEPNSQRGQPAKPSPSRRALNSDR
jgi:hypothetical protein